MLPVRLAICQAGSRAQAWHTSRSSQRSSHIRGSRRVRTSQRRSRSSSSWRDAPALRRCVGELPRELGSRREVRKRSVDVNVHSGFAQ